LQIATIHRLPTFNCLNGILQHLGVVHTYICKSHIYVWTTFLTNKSDKNFSV
jgi:hypothetical protein